MLSGKLERLSSFLLSLFETRSPLESESCSVMSWLFPTPLYSPWNSPGQSTGVGSCSLLQGIFPIQGLNSGLSHCGHILYQLSHKGSPRILEWVAYLFSNGSSRPRNWTGVCCTAGGFFFFSVFIYFYFIFLIYNIVFVLPYISMNLPRVYTCSQSWTPFPRFFINRATREAQNEPSRSGWKLPKMWGARCSLRPQLEYTGTSYSREVYPSYGGGVVAQGETFGK